MTTHSTQSLIHVIRVMSQGKPFAYLRGQWFGSDQAGHLFVFSPMQWHESLQDWSAEPGSRNPALPRVGLLGYKAVSTPLLMPRKRTSKATKTEQTIATHSAFPEVMAGEFSDYLYWDDQGNRFEASKAELAHQAQTLLTQRSGEQNKSGMPHYDIGTFKPDWKRSQYQRAFDKVIHYVHAGDCYQVNLAQRFRAPFAGDPLSAFLQVSEALNPAYAAYIDNGSQQVLSFSPELFVSILGKSIQSDPIKGTRPRGTDPQMDFSLKQALQNSEKDRAENLMIVDLLRNDLGKHAVTGSVKVPELFRLETHPNVHHLVSTIRAQLKDDADPESVLQACLPGGSITGAPKIRAMEIIQELESAERDAYCGSIFLNWKEQLVSNITIRTAMISQGEIALWGGGGIVADSNADEEYRESLVKIDHIVRALGAPSLL